MKKDRQPHVIMLRAAAILLVLVMMSTCMVAGRYARYTTSATGSDSARVAKFRVTETGDLHDKLDVKLRPGESYSLKVQVKNDSEVAVAYTVEADSEYDNLPLEFDLLDEQTDVETATLAPGETKNLAIRISWPGNAVSDSYIGMVDLIHLSIHVTQID